MGSCGKCSQVFLGVVNTIFLIIGAAMLGVGLWVALDSSVFLDVLNTVSKSDSSSIYGSLIRDGAYIFTAAGAAILLISFVGCCGAWKKYKCLLIIYVVVLVLIILLEIAVVVIAVVFYDKAVSTISGEIVQILKDDYVSNMERINSSSTYRYNTNRNAGAVTRGVDALQLEFRCCGVNNVMDYRMIETSLTCCEAQTDGTLKTLVENIWGSAENTMITFTNPECPTTNSTVLSNRMRGCRGALEEYVEEKGIIFITVGASILAFELLSVILALCLFCTINRESKANMN